MSTPVVTDKWAGTFDCSVCRRKRLVGAEFSKKALEKHRRTGGPLKCKKCVADAEAAERRAASERAARKGAAAAAVAPGSAAAEPESEHVCAACAQKLPASAFNKNQLAKGEKKARCRACVETSLRDEARSAEQGKEAKIAAAKERVRNAKTPLEQLKAESQLAALEAEHVTGLAPVAMGKGGRGRGGRGGRTGRGRGRGRGRAGGRGRGGR